MSRTLDDQLDEWIERRHQLIKKMKTGSAPREEIEIVERMGRQLAGDLQLTYRELFVYLRLRALNQGHC